MKCARVAGTKIDYQLTEPLEWTVGGKFAPHPVTIPAGFQFNSSVPWWLWWLLSPHRPDLLLAACVHDYVLEMGHARLQAAGEWLDGARAAHAPKWVANAAGSAVALWAIWTKGKVASNV